MGIFFGRTAIVWAACLTLGLSACAPPTEVELEQSFEAGVMENEKHRPLWQAIKTNYPDDFDVFVKRGVEVSLGGQPDLAAIEAFGLQWMTEFLQANASDLHAAPDADILAYLDAHTNTLETLQIRALPSCAKLSIGESFIANDLGERTQLVIRKSTLAAVTTMVAGKNDPHPVVDPTDADFDALYAKMSEMGMSDRLIGILDHETALLDASEADQCEIGVRLYQANKALPQEQAARLAAYLLSPV